MLVADERPFDRDIQLLEGELKRLEAEYNMFFAGRLARLPHQTRARVDTLVKQQDRVPMRNTADRFRFESLQARFTAFCDLWDRTIKAREEGRAEPAVRGRGRSVPVAPAATPGASAAYEPVKGGGSPGTAAPSSRSRRPDGVVAEERFDGGSNDAARLRELHARLNQARTAAGEAAVPYERFETLVNSQLAKLGGQQATAVAFRVAVKEGKITVTARPVRGDGEE